MELKDWLGILGFGLGVGNAAWQVYTYLDRRKREKAHELRDAERDRQNKEQKLKEYYLQIFKDHLTLPTWKAKAYEAQDAGLSVNAILELLERVYVPFHNYPAGTQREIIEPMRNELEGRVARGWVKRKSES